MGQQGGLAGLMLPLAMFAAIFYFLILRPQKKKQKAHDDMLASISKGSEVITAGGFFGVVREVLDDSYVIELAEGMKVRILKSSISVRRNSGEKDSAPNAPKKKKKKLRNDNGNEKAASTTESVASDSSVENVSATADDAISTQGFSTDSGTGDVAKAADTVSDEAVVIEPEIVVAGQSEEENAEKV